MKKEVGYKSFLPYTVVSQMFEEGGECKFALIGKDCFASGAFIQPILNGRESCFDDTNLATQRFYVVDPVRFRYGHYRDLDENGNIEYTKKAPHWFWELSEDAPMYDSKHLFKLPEELQYLQEVMKCNDAPVGPRIRVDVNQNFKRFFDED